VEVNTHESVKTTRSAEPVEPLLVTMEQYRAIIGRRKWHVMGSILAGVLVAAVLCVVLPKSYRSSTLILIENHKIPDDYVKGIGGASIEERLTMIQQQVMSRTLLSQIIEEFKLYQNQVKRGGPESAIETIRKAIKVDTVGTSGSAGKSVESVTISFAHEDPMTAMKVTAKLASLFIEQNLMVREQLVTGVSTFLEQELHEAKKALEAQEQAISQYKTKYIGLLPEQMEANLRALDRLQTELNATQDLLHSQNERLGTVEKAIKEYEASGTIRGESGNASSSHTGMDPLVVRLRELERRLTTLMAEWKETYPDIRETKEEILSVRKQLAEKYGDTSVEKDGDVAKAFDPYLRELMKQRNELRAEVSSIKERRSRLLEQIKETERRVAQTPSREQEVMILVRDYENMQKNYQALLDKRLNAHVASNLEKRQKTEQFRVLDPANLPRKLDSPNRLLIMVLGVIGGCGLGAGLAVGLEQMYPTFRHREEVEKLPGVRILATVPDFLPLYHPPKIPPFQRKTLLLNGNAGADSQSDEARGKYHFRRGRGSGQQLRTHLNLISRWQPRSIPAEQYRMAATRLAISSDGCDCTVLGVTSAVKGEGKTTTVVNLGYVLARDLRRKTLLIDCDFHCPALHHYVNVRTPTRAGLIEFLDGQAPLEDCLSSIDEVSCSILPIVGAHEEHSELVRIQQVKEIMPKLRQEYDFVILNTPPVLPNASMAFLSNIAETMILVIRAHATPKPIVEQALRMLRQKTDTLAILNCVETASMPHYMYGYSSSYGAESTIDTVAK
jgi:polysaccharide chain length determinant protein (PEP-CTERM system associated)